MLRSMSVYSLASSAILPACSFRMKTALSGGGFLQERCFERTRSAMLDMVGSRGEVESWSALDRVRK